jgi:putative flippase GtrA
MKTLLRCAGSSLAAVAVEFLLLTALVSLLHVHYLVGALIAGASGCALCFVINRRWAFGAGAGCAWRQLFRHVVVVGGGMGLGMVLMWLAVRGFGLPYQVSWLLGGSVVFLAWTFPMQRWFTFRAAYATS